MRSIERIHGRIGKILLTRSICAVRGNFEIAKTESASPERFWHVSRLSPVRRCRVDRLVFVATGILRRRRKMESQSSDGLGGTSACRSAATDGVARWYCVPAKLETKLVAMSQDESCVAASRCRTFFIRKTNSIRPANFWPTCVCTADAFSAAARANRSACRSAESSFAVSTDENGYVRFR